MHNYIKITVQPKPDEDISEILMAELAEVGAESFDEDGNSFNAYVPEHDYSPEVVRDVFAGAIFRALKYEASIVEQRNWNAEWESGFKPVIVDDKCVVYAPFHSDLPDVPYKILISPEMTFGTGHHETTHLMLDALLGRDLTGMDVLDMGCGTGILAILAAMKGVASVLAVDNDPTAVENTRKNAGLNNASDKIDAVHGDSQVLHGRQFDLIAANINRNVLLNDMRLYAECLRHGGSLMISGFYKEDVALLTNEAATAGLKHTRTGLRNGWASAEFEKIALQ